MDLWQDGQPLLIEVLYLDAYRFVVSHIQPTDTYDETGIGRKPYTGTELLRKHCKMLKKIARHDDRVQYVHSVKWNGYIHTVYWIEYDGYYLCPKYYGAGRCAIQQEDRIVAEAEWGPVTDLKTIYNVITESGGQVG